MRLLDKKAIATTTASQKKSQIDEGMLIATKIDALRSTLSTLEAQHKAYLDSFTEELRLRTEELEQEIASRKREIVDLEEKRNKLLEPLDQAWEKLHKEQSECEDFKEDLAQKRGTLTLYAQELDGRSEKLTVEEERLKEIRQGLEKQTEVVSKTSLDAQNILLGAREKEERVNHEIEEKRKNINELEEVVRVREREIAIRENQLSIDEEDITNIKIQLEDQRKTLERALARLK